VSPVPALDYVDVMYNATSHEDVVISLTDATGRILSSESVSTVSGNNSLTIDLTTYSSGIYFITIQSDELTISDKFIKE